jgi:hypothetical protein
VLVDRGVGPLLVEAIRLPAGTSHTPGFLAGLVVAGELSFGEAPLGLWDMAVADDGAARAAVTTRTGATLLAFTLRTAA